MAEGSQIDPAGSPPALRARRDPLLAALALLAAAVAVWMLTDIHAYGTNLMGAGLLGWSVVVAATAFGPLPVGRSCARVLNVAEVGSAVSSLVLVVGFALSVPAVI